MAHYRTTVASKWDAEKAFTYLSNFANAQEWDPGVISGRRLDDTAIGVGSSFQIVAEFNGRPFDLTYNVTAFESPTKITLRAETPLIVSDDTITVTPTTTGCDVTYDAVLAPRGWLRLVAPLVSRTFQKVGDRARDSLTRVLNS